MSSREHALSEPFTNGSDGGTLSNPWIDKFQSEFEMCVEGVDDPDERSSGILSYIETLRVGVYKRKRRSEPEAVLTDFYLDALQLYALQAARILSINWSNGEGNKTAKIASSIAGTVEKIVEVRKHLLEEIDLYVRGRVGETDIQAYNRFAHLLARAGNLTVNGSVQAVRIYQPDYILGGLLAERQVVEGLVQSGINARYGTVMEDAHERTDAVAVVKTSNSHERPVRLSVKSRIPRDPILHFKPNEKPPIVSVPRPESLAGLVKHQRERLAEFVVAQAEAA